MTAVNDDEVRIAAKLREGKAVICNVNFGFMIEVIALPNERVTIQCPLRPKPIRGPAEAEYVRRAIAAWSTQLVDYDQSTTSTRSRAH